MAKTQILQQPARRRFDQEALELATALVAGFVSSVPEVKTAALIIDWDVDLKGPYFAINSKAPMTVETLTGLIKRNADFAAFLAVKLQEITSKGSGAQNVTKCDSSEGPGKSDGSASR